MIGSEAFRGSYIQKPNEVTQVQSDEIQAVKNKRDGFINTENIPEVREWSLFRRGVFSRPEQGDITLRLEADVVSWFRSQSKCALHYQTDIINFIREHMRLVQVRAMAQER